MHDHNVLLRLVALALLLYALFGLTAMQERLHAEQALADALAQEREELLAERVKLEEDLAALETPEEMERLAREKLGMVMPGETVFCFYG